MDKPKVKGFAKFEAYMAKRSVNVRQSYTPAVTIDGERIDGQWLIEIWRTTEMEDGSYWFHGTTVSQELVEQGMTRGWDLLVELLENAPA